jgi:hypothetical protein
MAVADSCLLITLGCWHKASRGTVLFDTSLFRSFIQASTSTESVGIWQACCNVGTSDLGRFPGVLVDKATVNRKDGNETQGQLYSG